jgi:hypothetical protein
LFSHKIKIINVKFIVSYRTAMFFAATLVLLSAEALPLVNPVEQNEDKPIGQENSTYVEGITSARARSLVGGVVGLTSVIIGWRARWRSARKTKASPGWSMSALVLGLTAMILSIVHLAANTGDFGTGGGKAGAIVALLLGMTGVLLNGFALRNIPK